MRTVQNLTGSPGRVPPTQHLRGRVAGDARWRAMPGANFVANDLSYCPPLWPDSAARTATATRGCDDGHGGRDRHDADERFPLSYNERRLYRRLDL